MEINSEDLAKWCSVAGDAIEDAGVRYMAQHYQGQDPKTQSLVLVGWILAMVTTGQKVGNLLGFFLEAGQLGLTEEQVGKALKMRFPDSADTDRIRLKVEEYTKLIRLGEGGVSKGREGDNAGI